MQVFIMAQRQFPSRMFTPGYEPLPEKSIHYFSGRRDLMDALKKALTEEEWEELRNSGFGVFVNFYELNFTWCSRMVHYMLTMQLDCNQKYEIWCLVGLQPVRFSLHEFEELTGLDCDYVENLEYPAVEHTDEMIRMWELLGVCFDVGPSYSQLVSACSRCQGWERQERIWLGYLAIYTSFIEAQHWTVAASAALTKLLLVPGSIETYPWGRLAFKFLITSVKKEANPKLQDDKNYQISGFAEVLNIWIYWACPGVATQYGQPFPNNPTPPLLAYQGSRNRKKVDDTLRKQTRVNSFVAKEFDDMFPTWDDAAECDEKVKNIVKAMMGHFEIPWRWSYIHWKNESKYKIIKKELALVKSEGVKSEVVKSDGNVKGVKRKREQTRNDDDDEVEAGDDEGIKKRAKSGGNDCDFVELMKELELKIGEGFNTVISFVNQGFLQLDLKIVELGNEVKKLKGEGSKADEETAKETTEVAKDGKDGSQKSDGNDGGDGGDGGKDGGDGGDGSKDGGDGGDGSNDGVDEVVAAHAGVDEAVKERKAPRKTIIPKKLIIKTKPATVDKGEENKEANIQTAVDVLVSLQNPLPSKNIVVKRSTRLKEKTLSKK